MDRDKALERVLRLIALALDPSQVKDGVPSEEARTAAWKACRLLHEHRLLGLATPDTVREEHEAPAPPPERRKRTKAKRWSQAWRSPPSTSPPKTRAAADDFAERYGTAPDKPETDDAPTAPPPALRRGAFGKAKFHGQCLYCGFVIYKGDEVYVMPGFGNDHKSCAFKRAGLEVE